MRTLVIILALSAVAACKSGVEPSPAAAGSAAEAPAAAADDSAAAPEAADRALDDDEAAADDDSAAALEPEPEVAVDPLQAIRDNIAQDGPLSPEARAVLDAVVQDEPPELLRATREDLEGRHYLTCDELNLHLWYEHVKDIGGAYAGVGSDQAYTFIGWMRPKIAWFTDYDPWVRGTHKIYRVAFEQAETREAFMDFWRSDSARASWALVQERWEGDEDLEIMRAVWREWNPRIFRRLRNYGRILTREGIPSFLSDDETYDFVRNFVLQERARPMLANLIDDKGLNSIGEISRQIEVPIRVLYLSNAEDYWNYPSVFRENMEALYFDEASLILRTNATKPTNGDYRYGMQHALNFQEWLREDYVRAIRDIWRYPAIQDEEHIPLTDIDGEPAPRRRR